MIKYREWEEVSEEETLCSVTKGGFQVKWFSSTYELYQKGKFYYFTWSDLKTCDYLVMG